MVERFTKPDYSNVHNIFIKSIVRGDILEPLWVLNANAHGLIDIKGYAIL